MSGGGSQYETFSAKNEPRCAAWVFMPHPWPLRDGVASRGSTLDSDEVRTRLLDP